MRPTRHLRRNLTLLERREKFALRIVLAVVNEDTVRWSRLKYRQGCVAPQNLRFHPNLRLSPAGKAAYRRTWGTPRLIVARKTR